MIVPVVLVVERYANQGDAVSLACGDKASAGFICKSGFDTLYSVVHGEQLIGICKPSFIRGISENNLCLGLGADFCKVLIS